MIHAVPCLCAAYSFGYGDRPLLWADSQTLVWGTEALSKGWLHTVAASCNASSGVFGAPQEVVPRDPATSGKLKSESFHHIMFSDPRYMFRQQ